MATLISCVSVIALIMVLNIMYKKTNAYHNQNYLYQDFLKESPNLCVLLGSTYGRNAFDGLKSLNLEATNLTISSQSIKNDYNNYIRIGESEGGRYVLIALAPCSLMYTGNKSFIKLKIPGRKDAGIKQFIDYHFPIMQPKRVLKLFFDDPLFFDIYENKAGYSSKTAIQGEMDRIIRVWLEEFDIPNLKDHLEDSNIKIIKKNTKLLDRLIHECERNGDTPIIVVVPFSKELNVYFSESFIETSLEEPIKTLSINNPGLKVLDYRLDSDFQEDTGLFIDGGFLLNRRGSRFLIRRLLADLPELLQKLKRAT